MNVPFSSSINLNLLELLTKFTQHETLVNWPHIQKVTVRLL